MKLQLDFDEKTVKIESDIQLRKLMKALKNLLPDWKEWSIKPYERGTRYVYHNPVWYVNPWYTEWRYWDPNQGINTMSPTLSVGTGGLTSMTSTTDTIQMNDYLESDADGCHFNVPKMSGTHDVLIN